MFVQVSHQEENLAESGSAIHRVLFRSAIHVLTVFEICNEYIT